MVNTEGQDLFLDEIYGYMEYQEGEMVYINEYNEEQLLPSYLLEYPKGFDKLSKKNKDLIEKLFLYGDNNDIPKYIINITEKDKLYKQDWNDIEYFLIKRKILLKSGDIESNPGPSISQTFELIEGFWIVISTYFNYNPSDKPYYISAITRLYNGNFYRELTSCEKYFDEFIKYVNENKITSPDEIQDENIKSMFINSYMTINSLNLENSKHTKYSNMTFYPIGSLTYDILHKFREYMRFKPVKDITEEVLKNDIFELMRCKSLQELSSKEVKKNKTSL